MSKHVYLVLEFPAKGETRVLAAYNDYWTAVSHAEGLNHKNSTTEIKEYVNNKGQDVWSAITTTKAGAPKYGCIKMKVKDAKS